MKKAIVSVLLISLLLSLSAGVFAVDMDGELIVAPSTTQHGNR